MGFGVVTKKLPPNVSRYLDRHGKTRWRFRKRGVAETQTTLPYDSPGWWEWYFAAAAGSAAPRQVASDRTKAGSISALVVAYYQSADFTGLASSTQATYRGILDRFRAEHGDKSVAKLEARHVRTIIDARSSTPSAANNLLRLLHLLMRFAVERDWRRDDPTYGVRKVRAPTEGFHTWSEEEIAAFEAKHRPGTRAHLALMLLLHTAQRRSDVVTMGRQHLKDGAIIVRQQKTKSVLAIPISPTLQTAIDAAPAEHLTFLVTREGKPFTPPGFTNWFRECAKAAGLPSHCSPHGLRKAAARRLAEAGCTAHQIMSMTGHRTLKEVSRYTSAANQEQLAKEALANVKRNGKRTSNV